MFGVWFLSTRGEIYAKRQRAGTLFACFRSTVKVLAPSLNFADAVKWSVDVEGAIEVVGWDEILTVSPRPVQVGEGTDALQRKPKRSYPR